MMGSETALAGGLAVGFCTSSTQTATTISGATPAARSRIAAPPAIDAISPYERQRPPSICNHSTPMYSATARQVKSTGSPGSASAEPASAEPGDAEGHRTHLDRRSGGALPRPREYRAVDGGRHRRGRTFQMVKTGNPLGRLNRCN